MGHVLKEHVVKKLYVIFANYLIGEELEYTTNAVLGLPVTKDDLFFLEKIFMEDVSPACHLFLRYDPYTYDIYSYEFEEGEIYKHILAIKKGYFWKYIYKVIFLYFRSIYYTAWKRLEKELILRLERIDYTGMQGTRAGA